MKSPTMRTIAQTIYGALFALAFSVQALAGPGPQQTYTPVKSMKEAERIKPGDPIAFYCDNCKSVKTMAADTDRSYLRSFTCDKCKKKFVLRDNPRGEQRGMFVLEDDAGHSCSLLRTN